jgi:hypothetical protein
LLAQTASARSIRYRELRHRRRGRHRQQARHGFGRRCPACGVYPSGFGRPGSGCPAVRCPVTWDRRPEGPALGRLLSSRLCGVQPSWSAPVRPDASGSSHAQAVALGPRSSWSGDPDPQEPVEARWLPSRRRLERRSRRPGRGRRCPKSRWSLGRRWRTWAAGLGAGRGGRACPLSDQPGQAGVRRARRGRRRGGHGSRLPREVAAPAAWLASSAGCATTVRGRGRALRPGGRPRRGH